MNYSFPCIFSIFEWEFELKERYQIIVQKFFENLFTKKLSSKNRKWNSVQ